MPGIDYTHVRARIGIAEVLKLSGFQAVETSGDQVRGPCLIHGSASPQSRSFAANLRKQTFCCFKCGASGNQLDLWVAISKLPLHQAARDLCERVGVELPQIRCW
jgi:DNA primase